MPTKKAGAAKAKIQTPKIVQDSIDKVASKAEELRDNLKKRAEDAASGTQRRATKLVLSVVDFEKTTFDNTFKILSQLQEQSEKLVQNLVEGVGWLPKEGKSIAKEWIRMLRTGRADFKKTVNKSFDLLTDYLDRVSKADGDAAKAPAAKTVTKKKAAKKKAVKKAAKPAATI